jgi:hypothetical protein
VKLLRSQCHLPARTARVARVVASFFWLLAKPALRAGTVLSSGGIQNQEWCASSGQVLAGFFSAWSFPVSVEAFLSNKAPKSDKVKLSWLLQKAQKPRQLHFAPWQRR